MVVIFSQHWELQVCFSILSLLHSTNTHLLEFVSFSVTGYLNGISHQNHNIFHKGFAETIKHILYMLFQYNKNYQYMN